MEQDVACIDCSRSILDKFNCTFDLLTIIIIQEQLQLFDFECDV